MIVPLGKIIEGSKSQDILGITDRAQIIDYINQALELYATKGNWNPYVGTLDLCSDCNGYVTLPSFVHVVLATNIGGCPAIFRNSWFEYHINGTGDRTCGAACGLYWDDRMWSPTFQDLRDWSLVAAICEDPIDGNGSLEMIVQGETIDAQYNTKEALTFPPSGPSLSGVRVKLLNGYASTDPAVTYFKKITGITKPVTRGYVKLLGFKPEQFSNAVTLGYYGPNETNPSYKKMKVSCACEWVRVKYRMKEVALLNDYDVIPITSYRAMLLLLKSLRLSDTNNPDIADKYEAKALQIIQDNQTVEDGPGWAPLQVAPGFGVGTVDFR